MVAKELLSFREKGVGDRKGSALASFPPMVCFKFFCILALKRIDGHVAVI